MAMGISSIVLMKNMPAVILAVILGTVIGLVIHLGQKIQMAGLGMQKVMSRMLKSKVEADIEYKTTMVTAIVLFCSSGTGIYGSIVSGMTGDHSILLAKSILDMPTAMIFACTLGVTTCARCSCWRRWPEETRCCRRSIAIFRRCDLRSIRTTSVGRSSCAAESIAKLKRESKETKRPNPFDLGALPVSRWKAREIFTLSGLASHLAGELAPPSTSF